MAKEIVGGDKFIEVYLEAPEDVCKSRAETDEFAKTNKDMAAFSDMAAPYEPPTGADLVLKTDDLTVDQSVQKVYELLNERGLLE